MLLTLSVISAQGAALGSSAYRVFDAQGGTIGRIEANDWVLPDPAKFVSSHHARIKCHNNVFYLQDISTNGTFLNSTESPVSKSDLTALGDGDRILIGDYEILVQLIDDGSASAPEPAPPAAAPMPAAWPVSPPAAAAMPLPKAPPVPAPVPAPAPAALVLPDDVEPEVADPLLLLGGGAPRAPSPAPLPVTPPPAPRALPRGRDPSPSPRVPEPPAPPPARSSDPFAPAARGDDPFAPASPDGDPFSPMPALGALVPVAPPAAMIPSVPPPAIQPAAIPAAVIPRAPMAPEPIPPVPAPPPAAPAAAVPIAPEMIPDDWQVTGFDMSSPALSPVPPPPPLSPSPSPSPPLAPPRVPERPIVAPPPPTPQPAARTPAAPVVHAVHAATLPAGSRPAVPTARPTAPLAYAPGAMDERLVSLLNGLGVDPERVSPETFSELGEIVRVVVQGLIDVLQSRTEVKNNFRVPMTTMRPVENNPLKFSLNVDDAIHNLFVKRNPGYLQPVDAFREGFRDVAFHQVAMLAGIRTAFNSMLSGFHPTELEETYERKLKRTMLLGMATKLKYWDLYCEQFEDFDKDAEATFQNLFGEDFAKAYFDQLQKLAATARARKR